MLDEEGHCLPPPFNHHVDGCGTANIRVFVPRGVEASALALYNILGFPTPEVPNAQSKDRLDSWYGPKRKFVGCLFNTRRMTVDMPEYKRQELILQLEAWLIKPSFTLVEAAELPGILENHTRYAKWA